MMRAAGARLAPCPRQPLDLGRREPQKSEDEDYVAEEEATSKRVEPAQGTKPGLKIKRPVGRQPMSKARMSTEKPIEPIAAEGKKRKEKGEEDCC